MQLCIGQRIATSRPRAGFAAKPSRPAVRSVLIRYAGAEQSAEEVEILGKDWPMQWSLASYEDCQEYYKSHVLKDESQASARLYEVMSRDLTMVTPSMTLADIKAKFETVEVSGMPVVDEERRLIGVVSKKDLTKNGETVADVMTSPPIAANPEARVEDAAALMLRHEVHRIPVVDAQAKVVGMITRSDILKAVTNHTPQRR